MVREGRLLMMTAPVWYGEYMFGGKPDSPYYQTAEGQLGAALPPKWADQDKIYNGGGVGGVWAVSNHTKNIDLTLDLLMFLSTSHQVHDAAVTFPAYRLVAQEWGNHLARNSLYAFDPFPVEEKAAYTISDEGLKTVRYFTWDPLVSGTLSQMREGKMMLEALPGYGRELKGLAEAAGYQVIDR
jgi:ABC-type glycerol-3-phosphate transport system substrate-binding protein